MNIKTSTCFPTLYPYSAAIFLLDIPSRSCLIVDSSVQRTSRFDRIPSKDCNRKPQGPCAALTVLQVRALGGRLKMITDMVMMWAGCGNKVVLTDGGNGTASSTTTSPLRFLGVEVQGQYFSRPKKRLSAAGVDRGGTVPEPYVHDIQSIRERHADMRSERLAAVDQTIASEPCVHDIASIRERHADMWRYPEKPKLWATIAPSHLFDDELYHPIRRAPIQVEPRLSQKVAATRSPHAQSMTNRLLHTVPKLQPIEKPRLTTPTR